MVRNMIRIYQYGEVPAEQIFSRVVPQTDVAGTVSEIIREVRQRGDAALRDYTAKFDGVKLNDLLVDEKEIEEAVAATDQEFIRVLKRAAANVRKFHEKQVRQSFLINDETGS